jgi:DNA polymerase (family 10)
MLQYFTGSKHHNIHLRTLALEKGLSLSEHGIKAVNTGKIAEYPDEESFYEAIGLPYIEPELREDRGEIEAAIKGNLPQLVTLNDIKGDLHMHTNYQFPTSHDLGVSHLHEHLDKAASVGYEYIGIADHNPKVSDLSAKEIAKIMEKRYLWYTEQHRKWKSEKDVELFVLCEVDILVDGRLALPEEAFEFVDGVIVSLHSSFRQSKADTTKRIIKALTFHPKVRIFGHPTGRLLNTRDGVDADWQEVMKVCNQREIAMEINAYPDRLDLPDLLVRDARELGVKFTIDSDSHQVDQMDVMQYGVSVARRGWCEKKDVLNTLPVKAFSKWLLHT